MISKIEQLIKKQEDVLILMQELNIEKTELESIDGQWTSKHWLKKLK